MLVGRVVSDRETSDPPQPANRRPVLDPGHTYTLAVAEVFRGALRGQEAFRKDDILNVNLQKRQWMEGNDLKAEFAIIKVHNHEPGPRNLLFPDQDREPQ